VSKHETGKLSEALAHIEHELSALWAPPTDGSPPKARVCMANLVVIASARRRDEIVGVLDALEACDVARTFLISVDPKLPPWGLEGEISARCHRDGDRLLCAERIDLLLGAATLARAPSFVAALCMPEVPTLLLLLEPAPPNLVAALVREASRIIVDSEALGLPTADALARATTAHFTDLAWLRLYPWRNHLASAFDDPRWRAAVTAIRRVQITTAGVDPSPEARLLLGWLASRLGWKIQGPGRAVDGLNEHVEIELCYRSAGYLPGGSLIEVEVTAQLGDAHVLLSIERSERGLQVVHSAEGLGSRVLSTNLEVPSLAALVDRAFASTQPDRAAREALGAAATLTLQGA
jgi:glucose-6-phosphate dehydrogenase assembly protein OpcA